MLGAKSNHLVAFRKCRNTKRKQGSKAEPFWALSIWLMGARTKVSSNINKCRGGIVVVNSLFTNLNTRFKVGS